MLYALEECGWNKIFVYRLSNLSCIYFEDINNEGWQPITFIGIQCGFSYLSDFIADYWHDYWYYSMTYYIINKGGKNLRSPSVAGNLPMNLSYADGCSGLKYSSVALWLDLVEVSTKS